MAGNVTSGLPREAGASTARPSDPILLIEDDEKSRFAIGAVLEDEGHLVISVENGAEAIAYLRGGGRAALILLDLMMPDSNGWQFRREQLADPSLADIPVVVMSGMYDPPGMLGTAGFVAKPVDPGRLCELVRRQLRDSGPVERPSRA